MSRSEPIGASRLGSFSVVFIAGVVALSGCSVGSRLGQRAVESPSALPATIPVDREAAERGELVYTRYCETCHGDHGDGRGVSAGEMVPRPRNLVTAIYKCRSTPSGTLPLPRDLRRTLAHGVPATTMPGWEPLGESQIEDVVEYVRAFSPRWANEPVQRPLDIPVEPPDTAASRAHGREVYDRVQCTACHGAGGRGDGIAVPSLRDDSGNAIVPFDFSGNRPLRCGGTPRDLYRTMITGVDGTPMPSFAGNIPPEEIWDLVHFVMSLRH